ncbi:MAG: sensor domain-containing diguanylate cyclase [Limnochordia bacterium]|jgi:diguanylate cyclase (GGDEF)-like protein
MSIRFKLAATMIVLGVLIVTVLTFVMASFHRNAFVTSRLEASQNAAQAIAIHIDGHLKGLARTTATLATMPALKGSVLASNAAYDSLDPLEREAEIDRLDKLWRAAIDAEDPFLEEFLHNPTADLLREQQNIVDDLFGEIFLTNRYGAVIAATGQLTNFAQGDEYWWQAAVHGGEGRVFFDDRGYDVSVGDFVLGVTAPVYHDGEVVGVLKNNLRILDLFGEIIEHYSPLYEPGSVQIARSGGLVIWEPEQASLSTQVPREVVSLLGTETTVAILADGDGRGSLFAVSPIVSTTALSERAFGGNEEAADQRLNEPLSIAMLDFDHFKKINDRLGHTVGDSVLKQLAEIIQANIRASDVLARWGGEEFILLMPKITLADAARVMDRLRLIVADEEFVGGSTVTISVGVTELRPGDGFDDLLKRVDEAQYRAKASGRNNVQTI